MTAGTPRDLSRVEAEYILDLISSGLPEVTGFTPRQLVRILEIATRRNDPTRTATDAIAETREPGSVLYGANTASVHTIATAAADYVDDQQLSRAGLDEDRLRSVQGSRRPRVTERVRRRFA